MIAPSTSPRFTSRSLCRFLRLVPWTAICVWSAAISWCATIWFFHTLAVAYDVSDSSRLPEYSTSMVQATDLAVLLAAARALDGSAIEGGLRIPAEGVPKALATADGRMPISLVSSLVPAVVGGFDVGNLAKTTTRIDGSSGRVILSLRADDILCSAILMTTYDTSLLRGMEIAGSEAGPWLPYRECRKLTKGEDRNGRSVPFFVRAAPPLPPPR